MKRRSAVKAIVLAGVQALRFHLLPINQHLIVKRQCGVKQNSRNYWA
jgi:hypothetical protein